LAIVSVSYLAVLAWRPDLRERIPLGLRWFGRPGSWQAITIVVAVLVVVCALTCAGVDRVSNPLLDVRPPVKNAPASCSHELGAIAAIPCAV
jgi:hypothetical protein